MSREELELLYDLLDKYYYTNQEELTKQIYYFDEEENYQIDCADILIELLEKVQEKLSVNEIWFINRG